MCALAVLALPTTASALCAEGGLHVAPLRGPQPNNLRILLSGWGTGVRVIRGLARRSPRLVSSHHEIPLRVVHVYVGEIDVAVAVLEPKVELRIAVTYLFTAEGVAADDLMAKTWAGSNRVTFRADRPADGAAPIWRAPPRVVPGEYKRLGCGPVSYARVAIDAEDAGPLFVKVELEKASSPRPIVYLVPVEDGMVWIGRGMCGGAFQIAPGESARATLTLVDLAGHETPAPGGPVSLVGPGPHGGHP